MRITNKQLRQRIRRALLNEVAVGITDTAVSISKKEQVDVAEFYMTGTTINFALDNIIQGTKGFGQALEQMMRVGLNANGISTATIDLNPSAGSDLAVEESTADAPFGDFIEGEQNLDLELTEVGNFLGLDGAIVSAKATQADTQHTADAVPGKITKLLNVILSPTAKAKTAQGILIKAGASYATFDSKRSMQLGRCCFLVYYVIPKTYNLLFLGNDDNASSINSFAGSNNPQLIPDEAATDLVKYMFEKEGPAQADILLPGRSFTPQIREVLSVLIALRRLEKAESVQDIFDVINSVLPGNNASGSSAVQKLDLVRRTIVQFMGFISRIITGEVTTLTYNQSGSVDGIRTYLADTNLELKNFGVLPGGGAASLRAETERTLKAALSNIFTKVRMGDLLTGRVQSYVNPSGNAATAYIAKRQEMLRAANEAFNTITDPQSFYAAVQGLNAVEDLGTNTNTFSQLTLAPSLTSADFEGKALYKSKVVDNINASDSRISDFQETRMFAKSRQYTKKALKKQAEELDIENIYNPPDPSVAPMTLTTVQDVIDFDSETDRVWTLTSDGIPLQDVSTSNISTWSTFLSTFSRGTDAKIGTFRIVLDDQPGNENISPDTLRALQKMTSQSVYNIEQRSNPSQLRQSLKTPEGSEIVAGGPDFEEIQDLTIDLYAMVETEVEIIEDQVIMKPDSEDPEYDSKIKIWNQVNQEKVLVAKVANVLRQGASREKGYQAFPASVEISGLGKGGVLPVDFQGLSIEELKKMIEIFQNELDRKNKKPTHESVSRPTPSLITEFKKLFSEFMINLNSEIELFNEYLDMPINVLAIQAEEVVIMLRVLSNALSVMTGEAETSTPTMLPSQQFPNIQTSRVQSLPENKIYERLLEKLLYTAKKRR